MEAQGQSVASLLAGEKTVYNSVLPEILCLGRTAMGAILGGYGVCVENK